MEILLNEVNNRCAWVDETNDQYIKYHDLEWGVPIYNDHIHFEFLTLEGAQAGLSWSTILNKREGYRRIFFNFDPIKVATLKSDDVEKILRDTGIVRNRMKIQSTISNAKAFINVQEEFGSFNKYVWGFVGFQPKQSSINNKSEYLSSSPDSDKLSSDLKKRGFSFVGSKIIYAYMQAIGMVNDHEVRCFRFTKCFKLGKDINSKSFV